MTNYIKIYRDELNSDKTFEEYCSLNHAVILEDENAVAFYTVDENSVSSENLINDEVVNKNEDTSVTITLSAFDIARYGNSQLYAMTEQKLQEIGEFRAVCDMKLKNNEVTYRCDIVEFEMEVA